MKKPATPTSVTSKANNSDGPSSAGIIQYQTQTYWRQRADLIYYQYLKLIMHCIGGNSNSIIDVGTGMAPYLEWFDWIDNKLSVDLQSAYRSERVQGYEGSIFDSRFDAVQFDICTCLQVLEHVREPAPFARRLLSLSPLVLVSVPYQWPKGKTAGHVNDPVTLKKLNAWFDAEANWYMKVSEPFAGARATRLFAIYCRDPDRRFGLTTWRERKQS